MVTGQSNPTNDSDESYSVTLPVGKDQLKEFLAGLLGRPQTISRILYGPFVIHRPDIEDVYVLLDQRISAQNTGALASFVARIVYDDNSSVQLNSFSDFKTYNEVKQLRSQALHLTWTYLVQFKNKTIYEKQQIDLSIIIGERATMIDAELSNHRILRLGGSGAIHLRISHSDRSWGSDIDSLLTGRLEQLRVEVHPLRRWISKSAWLFGFGTWAAIFGMALYAVNFVISQASVEYIKGISALQVARPTIENLNRTLLLLSKYLVNGGAAGLTIVSVVFVLVAFIGAIAAAVFVGEKADYNPRSFLLLTRQDEKDYEMASADNRWHLFEFFGSAILSLIGGLISNFLFYYCTKWWLLK